MPEWLAGFWASSAFPIRCRVGIPTVMMIRPSRPKAMRDPEVPCAQASATKMSSTPASAAPPSNRARANVTVAASRMP